MARLIDTTSGLTLEPLPGEHVLDGHPRTGHRPLEVLGGLEVGIWEMTPGTATDVETDEVFVVLSGSGSVTFDDGEVVALAPGVAIRLHATERTTWHVTETVRKVYLA